MTCPAAPSKSSLVAELEFACRIRIGSRLPVSAFQPGSPRKLSPFGRTLHREYATLADD